MAAAGRRSSICLPLPTTLPVVASINRSGRGRLTVQGPPLAVWSLSSSASACTSTSGRAA